MNSHMLDVGVQLSSPGNNGAGQDNAMSELDSLSVLPASGYSFHSNLSSTRPHGELSIVHLIFQSVSLFAGVNRLSNIDFWRLIILICYVLPSSI